MAENWIDRDDCVPIHILLVEDNAGDVFLTKKAFEAGRIDHKIQVAPDGESALSIIRMQEDYTSNDVPDLILLDMNLPRKSGKQILAEIKNDAEIKHIPVLMLTSSSAKNDICESYDLHVNGYIVKPSELSEFHRVVTAVENFWFDINTLPRRY